MLHQLWLHRHNWFLMFNKSAVQFHDIGQNIEHSSFLPKMEISFQFYWIMTNIALTSVHCRSEVVGRGSKGWPWLRRCHDTTLASWKGRLPTLAVWKGHQPTLASRCRPVFKNSTCQPVANSQQLLFNCLWSLLNCEQSSTCPLGESSLPQKSDGLPSDRVRANLIWGERLQVLAEAAC